MSDIKNLTGFIFLLLLCQFQTAGAGDYDKLSYWMEESGFENIQLNRSGNTLILAYENRIFRHEADAIAFLLHEMPLPESDEIIMLPKYLNIAMLSIQINSINLQKYRQGMMDSKDFLSKINLSQNTDYYIQKTNKNLTNPSCFKTDFLIEPMLSMQLGNFDRPIQALAEVAPDIQIQLNKGLILNAQALIPIYNNLKSMEGAKVRAGIINLSQNIRLPDNFFVTASIGTFSYDRFGVDFKTKKYFLNGLLGIYTQMGYTTWTNVGNTYEDRYFEKDNYFIGRLGGEYRFAAYDLLISASYGTFLYQDKGWRFDLLRQFDDLIVGFNGILTTDTYNVGFYLSIPVFPKKYANINKVRIRPSHYFNWGYNFRGQTYAGKNYSTGENILQKSRDFNPYFIKNQLIIRL
ncbi:MAG: YjbH domain-containing protein [Bacteroidetes bacterium]|nr:YjbH domain-containing protein [Bacteroidota bacterium]